MLGFCGSHRSGKTTTAKLVAERLGLKFYDGSFGKLAKEVGYDSVSDMTIETRIEMQEKVLALHLAYLRALPRPVVTDRTPLDYIGYALGEIGMHSGISPETSQRIHAYRENCIQVTKDHYGAIAILRPLPVYTVEDGKPGPCVAYQAHMQAIIEGAAYNVAHLGVTVGRPLTYDLDNRVTAIAGLFAEAMRDLDEERQVHGVH